MPRVVVDTMGGDLGLEAVIEGVARLTLEDNEIQLLLVGDADAISAALDELRHNPKKLQVLHSGPAVAMSEDPREAISQNPDCSINVAARLVQSGEAGTEIPALIIFAECFLVALAGDQFVEGHIPLIHCFQGYESLIAADVFRGFS